MTTHLTVREKEHLLRFQGYGNLDGPVWFVGMEERGHGEDRLRRRLQFERVEDLGRAHALLGIAKHHFPPYKLQPTWRTMCEIMLRLADVAPTTKNLQWYQSMQLGRFDSDTFLTELMPIPMPNHHSVEFAKLFGQGSQAEDQVRDQRIEMLGQLIAGHRPALVVCYGRANWKYYMRLFPEVEWKEHGRFRIGQVRDTRVFLTPHFVPHQMGKTRIARLCRLIAETVPPKSRRP